jgi:DNA adenine methylase
MRYPGGKGADGVYQAIINLMPKHRVYIEPFLGGGAILRHKKPAETNYAFEIDPEAFHDFAHAFHHPELHKSGALVRVFGPDTDSRQIWLDGNDQPALFLERKDAMHGLRSFVFSGRRDDYLIYVDAPYLQESRSTRAKIYRHEFMTPIEHAELLEYLRSLPANVMISHYDHPLYNGTLRDWRRIEFKGVSRGGPRTEVVWMNYAEPAELHDYRYLGSNFREREQITRQKKRWLAKLAAMPLQRRYALLSAIEEFSAAGIARNGDAAGDTQIGAMAAPFVTNEENGHAIEPASVSAEYYSDDAAIEVLKLSKEGRLNPLAMIKLYEDCGEWSASIDVSTSLGGSFYRLREEFPSRFGAIEAGVREIIKFANGELARTDATKTSRHEAKRIVEWARITLSEASPKSMRAASIAGKSDRIHG